MRGTLVRLVCCGVFSLCLVGCGAGSIPEGNYAGETACEIFAVDGSGGEVSEPFETQLTVVVGENSSLIINGDPAVVGAEHVRAIPTADLTLEVVGVVQTAGRVEVTYEPRPTLTGIEVTGTLVETYEIQGDSLAVDAEADLVVTDVDGPHPLAVECSAVLPRA